MLAPERAEAVSPDRALCLPTFSHFLIVNKFFSLSLSLARSLALSPSHTESRGRERKDRESVIIIRNGTSQSPRKFRGELRSTVGCSFERFIFCQNKIEKGLFR